MIRFGESVHVVHCIAPVDTASSAVSSHVIATKGAHWVRFIVLFGSITGDAAVVTLHECNDVNASTSTPIGFQFRKSATLGTDVMGPITAAPPSGATMAASDDDKLLCIDVDPAALRDGYPYVRVTVTPGGSTTACEVACIALLDLRAAQNQPSSALE